MIQLGSGLVKPASAPETLRPVVARDDRQRVKAECHPLLRKRFVVPTHTSQQCSVPYASRHRIRIECDRATELALRTGPVVLGRTHQAEMDLYSAVCAVQNLWLAARVENIGVGWVSIIRHDDLRAALGIPPSVQPIAYLCVGYVTHFFQKPELETAGWLPRMPLSDVVWIDRWHAQDKSDSLLECL